MAPVIPPKQLAVVANAAAQKLSDDWTIDPVDLIQSIHTGLLEYSEYTYIEIAYNRSTGYMAWLCSEVVDRNPDRVVYANGQGNSINEACSNAITNFTRKYGTCVCTL